MDNCWTINLKSASINNDVVWIDAVNTNVSFVPLFWKSEICFKEKISETNIQVTIILAHHQKSGFCVFALNYKVVFECRNIWNFFIFMSVPGYQQSFFWGRWFFKSNCYYIGIETRNNFKNYQILILNRNVYFLRRHYFPLFLIDRHEINFFKIMKNDRFIF